MWVASTAAWRVVLLLAASVAPWWAPVEVADAGSLLAAIGRLAVAAALYLGATWGIRRATGRYPGVAALAAVTLLAAPVVSAWCSGDRGPVARGVWVVAPLVWATLASIAAGPLAERVRAARAAPALGIAVIAAGLASLAAGGARIGSRDSLWRSAQAIDPGNESAAVAVAAAERAGHRSAAAREVLVACARARPESCACAEGGASETIDAGRYPEARRLLDASDACPRTPHRAALRAEALIGTGGLEDGEREAERAIERAPDDAHAVYARAWATVLRGRPGDARVDAERAVSLGRGVPAELLFGIVLFEGNDLRAADGQFERVLAEDPSNSQAAYDHALVADREHRYHDAREGYLRALELDANNADARYNLVFLTHSHGAALEAQHHFDVFRASYPNDGRITALRQLVAAAPPPPAP
jgi:tetratricopeptide (TPR) repeat protein